MQKSTQLKLKNTIRQLIGESSRFQKKQSITNIEPDIEKVVMHYLTTPRKKSELQDAIYDMTDDILDVLVKHRILTY